jgi:hypothetical protein
VAATQAAAHCCAVPPYDPNRAKLDAYGRGGAGPYGSHSSERQQQFVKTTGSHS